MASDRIQNMAAADRHDLRALCRKQLRDPELAAHARETLAALDHYEAELKAEEQRPYEELKNLSGEARMVAELELRRREKAAALRQAQDPNYVAGQLKRAVVYGVVALLVMLLLLGVIGNG